MINQQMLDYIKRQLQRGISQEEIKKSLMANGWQATDIQEALNSIIFPDQSSQSGHTPSLKGFNKVSVWAMAIIGGLVIGGGIMGYFAFTNNAFTTSTVQEQSEQVSSLPTLRQTQEKITPQSTETSEITLVDWLKYTDQQNRFSFSYPPTFGTPSQGTNDGFGDRMAAIRFSDFSSGVQKGKTVLGGEVALTKNLVVLDVQALGGLYDSITLEAFSDTLRNDIMANLPTLTTVNICGELAKEQHIDLNKPVFAALSQQQKGSIVNIDKTRNINPKVIHCEVIENTVTFHKEVTVEFGRFKNQQNIYGAIRFLKSPWASFQIIKATAEKPSQEELETITLVVNSLELK